MIRALSPYYVTTPLTYTTSSTQICEKFTLVIEVWDGASNASAGFGVSVYKITFNNTTGSTGTHDININAMIQDYIEFKQPTINLNATTQIIDGDNQRWVKTYNTYDDGITQYNAKQDFMTLGYSYGNEGKNYDTTNGNILLAQQDYKVSRTGYFIFPFVVDNIVPSTLTAKSYPSLELNKSYNIGTTNDSKNKVVYLWVDLNDTVEDAYVEVTLSTSFTTATIILDVVNECKYLPLDVVFQNKDGANQIFTFFKKQEESLSITDNHFETNRGQASDGFHQFVRHNVQGRTTLKAETGFIDEDNTEFVKQMLLSERIWSFVDGVYTPLNIVDKSFKYKTRQNDRLISYTVTFEKSYNEINNI